MGTVEELVELAGLPPVSHIESLDQVGYGLDNALVKATLDDGREVLLRHSSYTGASPRVRAGFLRAHGVGAPELLASDDTGTTLVEFIAGKQLAEFVSGGSVDDQIWYWTGDAFRRVHSVRFPAPLQGEFGPDALILKPLDPVEELLGQIEDAKPWLIEHDPEIRPVYDRLADIVAERAAEIRSEIPCLTHGDANLFNIIVGEKSVTLIDWDFPRVRYPLAELSALDEHVYLVGGDGLPPAFFDGYGRSVSEDLLFVYRAIGCAGWLSSDDWSGWSTSDMPAPARRRLTEWHTRLVAWLEGLPGIVAKRFGP